MPRLTAAATRGVRCRRERRGKTVTYQRSTLMAVSVTQVACTDTCGEKSGLDGPSAGDCRLPQRLSISSAYRSAPGG
ncbi:hypothetical protein NDU88_006340 [Pleurodeles waltl]|uniref:Uncharacterized protein n=1 Tax=Pleurodeles waltl TaxID=8319 RepID=A0AAV7LBU6_PLEWA|nr:hypothetical protein NDU88_006340 [Pleurodeles waltl]